MISEALLPKNLYLLLVLYSFSSSASSGPQDPLQRHGEVGAFQMASNGGILSTPTKLNSNHHYSQSRPFWSNQEVSGPPWRLFRVWKRWVCSIKTTATYSIHALYQRGEGDLWFLKAPRLCWQPPFPLSLWNKEEPGKLLIVVLPKDHKRSSG